MAIQLSYTSAEIEERLQRMDLDSTLTLSDHAADAKAVGDVLQTLSTVTYDSNGNIIIQAVSL